MNLILGGSNTLISPHNSATHYYGAHSWLQMITFGDTDTLPQSR